MRQKWIIFASYFAYAHIVSNQYIYVFIMTRISIYIFIIYKTIDYKI